MLRKPAFSPLAYYLSLLLLVPLICGSTTCIGTSMALRTSRRTTTRAISWCGMGSKTTCISPLTTCLFVYMPLLSTFYIRFWALRTRRTNLSGRPAGSGHSHGLFWNPTPRPSTKIQTNYGPNLPSIRVSRLRPRTRTRYGC
jgi:hypothetical protein